MPILWAVLTNKYVIGLLLIVGLVTGAYFKGKSVAEANCHDAELQAKIATMQRDLTAWKAAGEIDTMLQKQLESDNQELQDKVTEYATDVATAPADAHCTLTDRDVRSLDGLRVNGKR